MATEQHVRLVDGRRLAYLDVGARQGAPLIHLHGAPSGKLEASFFDLHSAAQRSGVRLLAIDRPGIGGSDARPGRTLLEWPADVAGFADALGLGSFGVLGYSMGAASALACLHGIAGRLTRVLIVSGIGPPDIHELETGRSPDVARILRYARTRPRTTAAMLAFMRLGTRKPQRMLAAAARDAPTADQAIAAQPHAPQQFADFLADALRQGPRGARDDLRLAASPWGFTPEDGPVPVDIWHGTADRNVPVAAAHRLAAQLPSADLRLERDAGHISLLATRADAILASLGS